MMDYLVIPKNNSVRDRYLPELFFGKTSLPRSTTKNTSVTNVFFVNNIPYRWISRLVSFLGFGLILVFVPDYRLQKS